MKKLSGVLFLLIGFVFFCSAREGFRVMFYNVENFFDCKHDSLKDDFEYLPGGMRGWTPARFWKKAGQIAKVVSAVGENRFPEMIGLAEVENENCIQSLIKGSPLKNAGYSSVHDESPDARGIDVCLLYNRYLFTVLRHHSIPVVFQDTPTRHTRDILYVCGRTHSGEILNVFVCHFPSRLGGELESQASRRTVAKLIREEVDSIFSVQEKPNVLIMGDFNDYPTNRSLSVDLMAGKPVSSPDHHTMYNLMLPLCGNPDVGTNKYQAEWGILDQMVVSGSLLKKTTGAHIFDADFLLIQDERWLGRKPFRTYHGMVYHGGFSDHLPVYADFKF
ncbi:MAG: endonuclease [Bacteroidales bacterium]|nr:endonuclease [Bacteroidales bacterium]